jgi:hypothetical protein
MEREGGRELMSPPHIAEEWYPSMWYHEVKTQYSIFGVLGLFSHLFGAVFPPLGVPLLS